MQVSFCPLDFQIPLLYNPKCNGALQIVTGRYGYEAQDQCQDDRQEFFCFSHFILLVNSFVVW